MAASLLRIGCDTRAARLFKELGHAGAGRPVERLASLLEPAAGRALTVKRAEHEAAAALERARRAAIGVLPVGQPGYPVRLAELPDPPIVLWTRGDPAWLARPAIAIVGSRRASAGSLLLARRLARDLARAGLVVVSGMALGVDMAAHEGALEGGGATVAILGAGVDVVYPRKSESLVQRVVETGCVASELPPGTLPLPRHFPLRNRIISGLAVGVVVIEAAERSGSLITARTALEQGREVLAVPGAVVSGCHRGCHALIKDGAGLVEDAADVLAAIGWSRIPSAATRPAAGLLGMMRPGAPASVDELAASTGRSAPELLAELGALEVAGAVSRMPGGLFVRVD